MTKDFPCISIAQECPTGFQTLRAFDESLFETPVILYADSMQAALSLTDKTKDRLSGLILYSGSEFACKEIAHRLWSVSVLKDMRSSAARWAQSLLAALLSSVLDDDRFRYLELELASQKAIVETTEKSYAQIVEDMRQTIRELQNEIKTRKKIEKSLKESEERNRTYIENAPAGIFIVDHSGRYQEANKAAQEQTGYTRDELLQMSIVDLVSEEDREEVLQAFSKLQENNFLETEVVFLRKDGTRRTMQLRAVALTQDQYMAFSQDITKRMRIQEKLRESEERLEMALSVANDGIWDWHLDTNEVYFDERYYTMAGYEPDEFPGAFEEWKKRVHPEDFPSAERAVQEYLAGKIHAYDVEFRFLRKDGNYMWIRGRGKIVERDAEGKPFRFIGTHADITQRKQAEADLRRAQKMEALGQLTGGIAHDFNNILGIILGNTRLLEPVIQEGTKAKRRLDAIRRSAERAADLTRQLLSFSRKQVAQLHIVNVNHIVRNMKDLIERSLTPAIRLEYHLEKRLWYTKIDTGDFEDALLNLILNARDAMPQGGRIIIETFNRTVDEAWCANHPEAEPGDYILLVVSDSGEGIPQDVQQHIFEPFFTTKEMGRGTGLGLALVFGFVKRSGGLIEFHSKPGIGSSFRIYLPREHSAQTTPVLPTLDLGATEFPRGTETILVVDDEEDLLEVACDSIRSLGYQVISALSAQDALEILTKKKRVDLLFSDVVLPGEMNGYRLVHEALLLQPDLRVVLTSGYTSRVPAYSDEHSFYLINKPYALKDLAKTLRFVLDSPAENRPSQSSMYLKLSAALEEDSLGFEALEEDNKELFSFLKQAVEGLGQESKFETIEPLLRKLSEHIEEHFKKEEAIMKACEFSDYKNHSQVHRLLLKQFQKMMIQAEEGRLSHNEIIIFLLEWWMEHEQSMDRAFVSSCQGKEDLIDKALKNLDQEGHTYEN